MDALALPAFQPFAIFSVLLVAKMAAVAVYTAATRSSAKTTVNPEDAPVFKLNLEAAEAPSVARAKRAHMNDLENIPPFLIIAGIFTAAGGSAMGGWAYFGFFFAVRCLHTLAYLNQAQPWRTASWALGQLAQLGLMVQILMMVLKG